MESLFGAPMDTLMVVFLTAFVIIMALVAVLALRNRVFFKLGVQNIPRVRSRTALVILGLMLGTLIISAAFSTGDTMSHTVRSTVLRSLGNIDEVVSVSGTDTGGGFFVEESAEIDYFDESNFEQVRNALQGNELVDGIAPAIMEFIAVQDQTSRQNEPRVFLFATDPQHTAGFGEIEQVDGGEVSLADLVAGEVYMNDDAADELGASAGDQLLVFAAGQFEMLRVKAVVDYRGTGFDGPSLLMGLDAAQQLFNQEGQIEHILISNEGGSLSGVGHTDGVISALEPVLTPLGLEADPTKEDAIALADELGSTFTGFFVTFGTFSIIAGMLLIFLIFVMLAAERKPEMGIARAVGIKRRHLIQMFLFEGVVYDLTAAAIGAALGLIVAYGMVFIMARAFATFGLDIQHDFRPRSLIVAYTLGMLLTFIVVTVSAWRVSVLNIISAIRDLPEPVMRRGGRFTLVLGVLALLVGLLMIVSGLSGKQATPFHLGISFVVISMVPLLRRLGLSDRIAYTVPGLVLLVWWLLPFKVIESFTPELSSDISIFIVSGTILVIASTWTIMYNSDLILSGIVSVFGRFRTLAPVIKTAVAYPLVNRFRTGMTLAMFSLVVFTLVVMATLTSAFTDLFNDEEAFSGGFDIRATTLAVNPVPDMQVAIDDAEGLDSGDFTSVANQSVLDLEVRQVGYESKEFESYPVHGFGDEFLAENTYDFALIAEGYGSAREVWQALADNPNLAIIDPIPVPRRDNFNFQAGVPELKLEGFFFEDEQFTPVPVAVQDPQTGEEVTLTVIGVLKDTFPFFMLGLGTSQQTLQNSFDSEAVPTVHFFDVAEGVDAGQAAETLEAAFVQNDIEAESLEELLEEQVSTSLTFNYILQGFMGLGLVVGVAALGVISARSVVERRQQIGVLRAIGFRQGMVQLSFLVESSFIALLGMAVGTILGLIVSFNIILDSAGQESGEGISFAVPWLNLLIIFIITYLAALLTSYFPARQASRVYPAEALRYE